MYLNEEDVIIAIFLSIVAIVIVGIIMISKLERECLSLGYRESNYRLVGPSYCMRRTNQSDIVITIDSARVLGRVK